MNEVKKTPEILCVVIASFLGVLCDFDCGGSESVYEYS